MERYDYIVVGSGAGGGPVAANLAEAGKRVLLLEAGGAEQPPSYEVPCFHAFASEDPALRWDYFVRHYADDSQQRRDNKYCADQGGVLYPRSGTLGGCTAHNAQITIYPHNADWDRIAEMTGDDSWRSHHMRSYFERLENCQYKPLWRLVKEVGIDPTRHGFHGWLSTEVAIPAAALEDEPLDKILLRTYLDALKQRGESVADVLRDIESSGDPNDWRSGVQNGRDFVGFTPLATHRHGRNGTRERILDVQRRFPDRLVVKTHCLATRVVFDDAQRATGVGYIEGAHLFDADPAFDRNQPTPAEVVANVSGEVILSGGAFNTPQLLMLSGIGPAATLQQFGIPVRVDLAGVGANLQDRYEIGVVNRMKDDWEILKGATFSENDDLYKQWRDHRDGVYTTNGAILGVMRRSNPTLTEADLFLFALIGKFHGYFPGYSKLIAEHHNYLTWAVLKAHTINRAGRVTLASADPRTRPAVDFRYFDEGSDQDGKDLDAVVEGVKLVRQLATGLGQFVDEEELPGKDVQSDAEIRTFVRDNAWGHHASCSCPIGKREDGGVLRSDFRVHGTTGLRVVDASVFPAIPGFFIVTPIYMIAEKASDVILHDAGHMASAASGVIQ